MGIIPCNNYRVGEAINKAISNQVDSLTTSDLLMPVLLCNPADSPAQVQPSFAKPNTKQILKSKVWSAAAANDAQIVTASLTTAIYYVGAIINQGGAANCAIKDATSGSYSLTNGDTDFVDFASGAAVSQVHSFSVPMRCVNGIRAMSGAGSGTPTWVIFWIEEQI